MLEHPRRTAVIHADTLYSSLHWVGERLSTVLPLGNDLSTENFAHQYVRIEPGSYYREPSVIVAGLQSEPRPRISWLARERTLLALGGTLVALFSLFSVCHLRRSRSAGRDEAEESLITTLGITGLSIVAVTGMVASRIVLTGVDEGRKIAALQVGDDGTPLWISGNSTLAMDMRSLAMLYVGSAILLYTCATWLGLRLSKPRRGSGGEPEQDGGQSLSGSIHLARGLGYATIATASLFLILAPWTNTILWKITGR